MNLPIAHPPAAHVIETLCWSSTGGDRAQAIAHQARVSDYLRGPGRQLLDRVFTRLSPGNEVWCLDSLEVDLGRLPATTSFTEWSVRLEQALWLSLHDARRTALAKAASPGPDSDAPIASGVRPGDERALDHFLHYLQRGHLPWAVSPRAGRELADWLARLAQRFGLGLWLRLQRLHPAGTVLLRLGRIAPHHGLQALLSVRDAELAASLEWLDAQLLAPLHARGRLSVYQLQGIQQAWRVAGLQALWGQHAGGLSADRLRTLREALAASLGQQLGHDWRRMLRHPRHIPPHQAAGSRLGEGLLAQLLHRGRRGPVVPAGRDVSELTSCNPMHAALLDLLGDTTQDPASLCTQLEALRRRQPHQLQAALRVLALSRARRSDWRKRWGLPTLWPLLAALATAADVLRQPPKQRAPTASLDPRNAAAATLTTGVAWAESLRQFALQTLASGVLGRDAPGLSSLQAWLADACMLELALGGRPPQDHAGWTRLWQRTLRGWPGANEPVARGHGVEHDIARAPSDRAIATAVNTPADAQHARAGSTSQGLASGDRVAARAIDTTCDATSTPACTEPVDTVNGRSNAASNSTLAAASLSADREHVDTAAHTNTAPCAAAATSAHDAPQGANTKHANPIHAANSDADADAEPTSHRLATRQARHAGVGPHNIRPDAPDPIGTLTGLADVAEQASAAGFARGAKPDAASHDQTTSTAAQRSQSTMRAASASAHAETLPASATGAEPMPPLTAAPRRLDTTHAAVLAALACAQATTPPDSVTRLRLLDALADPTTCAQWLRRSAPVQRWALLQRLFPKERAQLHAASTVLDRAHARACPLHSTAQREQAHWQFLARHLLVEGLPPQPALLARRYALHLTATQAAGVPRASALAHWLQRLRRALGSMASGSPTPDSPPREQHMLAAMRSALRKPATLVERSELLERARQRAVARVQAAAAAIAADNLRTASPPPSASVPSLSDPETHYLDDAGLVLLATWTPRLFARLDLLDGNRFRDPAAAARAVRCLAWLTHGHDRASEPECVLPRLLCGLDMTAPLAATQALDAETRALLDSLLQSLIAHWGALGQTSLDGLRQTFLQREGRLTHLRDSTPPHWHLAVAPGPFDMLLDRLPWSFATLKLPWMPEVLHVQWR